MEFDFKIIELRRLVLMKSISKIKFILLVLFLHIVNTGVGIWLASNNLLKFAIVLCGLFTAFIGIFMKDNIEHVYF